MKIMPANISGAPLPSATNVTPATSSLNPSKSEILVLIADFHIMVQKEFLTYKNGYKESISSHTKCNKKIHQPNEIRHLESDDIRFASTVTTFFETRALTAFNFCVSCVVFMNIFIILSKSGHRFDNRKFDCVV